MSVAGWSYFLLTFQSYNRPVGLQTFALQKSVRDIEKSFTTHIIFLLIKHLRLLQNCCNNVTTSYVLQNCYFLLQDE